MNDPSPEPSSPSDEQKAFETRLKRKAGCQRRVAIGVGLWALSWSWITAEDFISYTSRYGGWSSMLGFNLFFSFFGTVLLLVPALIGRLLGNLRPLRPVRYYLVFALPVLTAVGLLVPSILTRLNPERRFVQLTDSALPSGARIMHYESNAAGFDGSVEFTIRGTDHALDELIRVTGFEKADGPGSEDYTHSDSGSFISLEINRRTGTATYTYSWL